MKVRAFYSSYFSVLPARINFLISKKKKKKKNQQKTIMTLFPFGEIFL